jgi:hypothetical protein
MVQDQLTDFGRPFSLFILAVVNGSQEKYTKAEPLHERAIIG